jgi:Mrp family chromosome partitioning ATPase
MADGRIGQVPPVPRFLSPEEAKRLVFLIMQRHSSSVAVQLIAATSGEGTSALSRDLALGAVSMGLKVLLLEAGTPPGQHTASFGLATPMASPSGLALYALGASGMSIATPCQATEALANAAWPNLLPLLRKDFDLIVLDSASLAETFDGVARASLVDLNLLVVEAERTRITAVGALRNHILDAGGTIGGVLLNRRRRHLPEFLNRML